MTDAANLARLSAAATQGEWEVYDDTPYGEPFIFADGETVAALTHAYPECAIAMKPEDVRFIATLVNLYRSGRLVLLPSVEDMARVIFPILWNKECYNGVRLQDIDQYRIGGSRSMGGRVERYEAEALSLATALHNHLKGTGDE